MAKDLLYYFDKYKTNNNYVRHELGEVQQNFNMSMSINGDKDTAHFTVVSFSKIKLEPYTILWHEKTDTWWIVSKDDTKRYANEIGFMYVHELQCLGAIELCNARELVGCGFRANRYTIKEFFTRLIDLSNFEYAYNISDTNGFGQIKNNKVDYLKSFENYTLLSALREFFNGYNYAVKLHFRQSNTGTTYYLIGGVFTLHNKSGNTYYVNDIDDFKDVREDRSIDKNSFGGKVISNTQNVVSTKVSRFPAVGVVGLTSNDRTIVSNSGDDISTNACIRLPENVYRVKKLTLAINNYLIWFNQNSKARPAQIDRSVFMETTAYDEYNLQEKLTTLFNKAGSVYGDDVKNAFLSEISTIMLMIKQATSFEFYDGFKYDALNDKFKFTKETPSGAKILTFYNPPVQVSRKIVLTDKATRDTFALTYQGIYWERGSNLIKGFEYFGTEGAGHVEKQISVTFSILGDFVCFETTVNSQTYYICVGLNGSGELEREYFNIYPKKMMFFVDYVPMGDLKIDVDNRLLNNDVELYNQNGKMNSGNSLSKLVNAYSEEITTDNLTRYCDYYSFSVIPEVGDLVDDNGVMYVINNISYDFYENENGEYKIEAEFTMSKQVAVKSTMVNANSNIRDYGIPQDFNVERTQVYKDTLYFGYTRITTSISDFYVLPRNFIPCEFKPVAPIEYTAFIRCGGIYSTYNTEDVSDPNPTGTKYYSYYKLPVTRFLLKKEIIYKLNFRDNNIIGYDSQNVVNAWSPTNLLHILDTQINTPVTYTDDYGEVEEMRLALLDTYYTSQVFTDYGTSQNNEAISSALYTTVIINNTIYDNAVAKLNSEPNFAINDDNYGKDAIEVPVFEYVVQMMNTDDIFVADNFFDSYEENAYQYRQFFNYKVIDDDYVNEQNALANMDNTLTLDTLTYKMQRGCLLDKDQTDNSLVIEFFDETRSVIGANISGVNVAQIPVGSNIAIYRYVYDVINVQMIKRELYMILRKVPSGNLISSRTKAKVYINKKK